jgi:hypothetical protein
LLSCGDVPLFAPDQQDKRWREQSLRGKLTFQSASATRRATARTGSLADIVYFVGSTWRLQGVHTRVCETLKVVLAHRLACDRGGWMKRNFGPMQKKGRKGGALERRELTVVVTAEVDCFRSADQLGTAPFVDTRASLGTFLVRLPTSGLLDNVKVRDQVSHPLRRDSCRSSNRNRYLSPSVNTSRLLRTNLVTAASTVVKPSVPSAPARAENTAPHAARTAVRLRTRTGCAHRRLSNRPGYDNHQKISRRGSLRPGISPSQAMTNSVARLPSRERDTDSSGA